MGKSCCAKDQVQGHSHTIGQDFVLSQEIFKLGLFVANYGLALWYFLLYKNYLSIFFFLIIYLLTGWHVLKQAWQNILLRQFFDENFLMTIATLGAIGLQEYPEAVGVMLFYKIGTFLQDLSISRSRKNIQALLDIKPDYARLLRESEEIIVAPEEIKINDVIVVRIGEKIPLDGVIIEGKSYLDTSALTGESTVRSYAENDVVLAGMINKSGLLKIKVHQLFVESSIAKIHTLLEKALEKKSQTELFFTKFSRYYTPAVLLIAFLTALILPLIFKSIPYLTDKGSIYRAFVILMISCPCALVVSIPLTYFAGIGIASKKGILIKGTSFIDSLTKIKAIVFDKTGTLTKGVFQVTQCMLHNVDEQTLLQTAAEAESQSNHPIAQSIIKAYNQPIDISLISNYLEIEGQGISALIRGQQVLVGNKVLMKSHHVSIKEAEEVGTIVYVAINNDFAGYLVISDELKEDSLQALTKLKKMGLKELHILSGDNFSIVKKTAETLEIKNFQAELLPENKVTSLEKIMSASEIGHQGKQGATVYIGDGINDAPVIGLADVGISMGHLGSDLAIESADIVLADDSLTKLPELIMISQKTRRIIMMNLTLALLIKIIFLILGSTGHANLWEAVFADVGVAVLAILNASRMLNLK